uniref:uncharacterized protein LOC131108313 n=1 Tax=Doryrhamphus excisus TaxID=161450 RepID=UPI0025ADF45D|nr:uncharacterized protein LOC131108313 [Doryrhamphus excisus]
MDLEENYSIRAEVILPIVEKHFDRILPAQWSMLATGTIDSATQVVLADMCTEITQKLCADTIRLIIPEFKQRIQSVGKKKMKLKVEGGLSTAFASALSVPEQPSKSSQKLDSLFKKEISQRVNQTLSTATSTDSQLAPLIYIPGTFTKIEVLAKMVLLACGALKVYLSKMAIYTQCFRPCRRQQKSQESINGAKCGNVCIYNREETKEAVINILQRWADSEDRSLSSSTTRDLKRTAASIVETIINDLHYSAPAEEGHSRTSTPHFDLGLIKDQLCEFFESLSPTSSNESSRKRNFLDFCQKKFGELTSELQKVRCRCMRMRLEEEMSLNNSAMPTKSSDTDTVLSFQGIQSGLEDVFNKVAVPEGDASIDVDRLRHEADTFSQELADRIYNYMTTNRTTVQSASVWRRFSDPLILEVDNKKPENIQVLHKIVEDTSTKFVQQLLLWLKMEPIMRGKHADQVYGCLKDIDTLITGTMIPQKKLVVSDGRSEALPSQVPTSSMQKEMESDATPEKSSLSGVIRVAWPSPLRPPSAQGKTHDTDTSLSKSSASDKVNGASFPPVRSASMQEEMVASLVSVLIVQLLTCVPKRTMRVVHSVDTLPIIQRLSRKVLQDKYLRGITDKNLYSVNKVMKVVIEELKQEFHSTEMLVEALLSDEPSFDDAILRQLTLTMGAPRPRRTKKMCSTVHKVFLRTFCIRPPRTQ